MPTDGHLLQLCKNYLKYKRTNKILKKEVQKREKKLEYEFYKNQNAYFTMRVHEIKSKTYSLVTGGV